MRYALLINERPGADDPLDEHERAALSAEYMAFHDDPRVVGGEHLLPAATATTVRMARMSDSRGSRQRSSRVRETTAGELLLTDGPFADTKEIFGGFFLVEAPDLDSALELAGRVPALRFGGSVEIRPLAEIHR
jgi:hypothetical protein